MTQVSFKISISPFNLVFQENEEIYLRRIQLAQNVLQDMIEWIKTKGDIGIFDAANITVDRRKFIYDKLEEMNETGPFRVIFIETICTDSATIQKQCIESARFSPEYAGMSLDLALADMKVNQGCWF
jgi:hypothetical protein